MILDKLTEIYNEFLEKGISVFTGDYNLSDDCDSVVIKYRGRYGVFLDIEKIRTYAQELEAVSHEYAHIETGTTYSIDAPYIVRRKAETRATRAQIKKLLPFNEVREAIRNGYTEPYQLAEFFSVSERFVRQALEYYSGPCGYSFVN